MPRTARTRLEPDGTVGLIGTPGDAVCGNQPYVRCPKVATYSYDNTYLYDSTYTYDYAQAKSEQLAYTYDGSKQLSQVAVDDSLRWLRHVQWEFITGKGLRVVEDQRYYTSNLGRFMTPDPSQNTAIDPSDPKSPLSWNRFIYALGDPINGSDPTGLDPLSCLGDANGYDDLGQPSEDPNCSASASTVVNFTDQDISGTYCTDENGFAVSCDVSGAVVTGIGPGEGPSSSTVTGLSFLETVVSDLQNVFGLNPNIPLPSCFVGFIENTFTNLVPFPPSLASLGEGVGSVVSAIRFNQAVKYATSTPSRRFGTPFLVNANKSTVFQKMMRSALNVGKLSAWASVALAEAQALWDEIQASGQGQCQ